ncbi:MAG: tetratricopeptide repeat protein [Chloroflexi bacterium]|nr:tetratricopeptide repeat protein [Chloroflexota bacterium]
MIDDQAKQLRKAGVEAAKAGDKDRARQLLQQSLQLDPNNEAAWIWLMTVARDRREKLICLYKLLEINPNNTMGQEALASLNLTPDKLAEELGIKTTVPTLQPMQRAAPTPVIRAPQAAPETPQAGTVPVADPQRVAQAQAELDALVREYLAPFDGYTGIAWTRKTRSRAGERDSLVLRAYVAAGVAGALVIILIIGAVVILNNPAARTVLFAPTGTPTRTPAPPTATFTPTPGVTPTPSPTPELTLTPSPTVPPNIRPGSDAPEPTAIYPPVQERTIRDAVALMNQGRVEEALPTLVVEVTLVGTDFNPNPYFYRAMALARLGRLDAAAELLRTAERRLPEKPNEPSYAPLVNAGLAWVDALRAEQALDAGRRDEANALLRNIEDRAETAIAGDPRLELPYLALARRHRLVGDYDAAITALDEGLAVPELAGNVNLIIEKGQQYFDQREYDLAAYQAFLALYADPTAEAAHLLQIKTALAQDNPGLAVLLAQRYLFYYPGSVEGYTLLGEARVREGNFDLALEAYNQALAGGEDNPFTAEVLVARAQLYEQRRRYDLARDDYTRAYTLTDDLTLRARRMLAAYNAGNIRVAEEDARALLGAGVIPDAEIQLLQARILIDQAREGETAEFEQALNLLETASGSLSADLRPVADEYRARAQYNLGSYDDALRAINNALSAGETGSRHYLRGLILEAQGKDDLAARDYDWVMTWGTVYPYPFLPDARQRLQAIQNE